jgi:hypothetical protein
MTRLIRIAFAALILPTAAVALVACDDAAPEQAQQGAQSVTTSADSAGEPLPGGLILEKSPADPKDVIAVRKSAKAGDTVTVRGRVGGSEKPLADNRAILTILDPNVVTCEKMPGDACETPWDACCDPDATSKSATVQVVGADGRPLKASLAGVGGIAPLKELIITGKVRTAADGGALVVDATGIFVAG